jgi:phosphoenolpyruvate carboxykinase (GTP)
MTPHANGQAPTRNTHLSGWVEEIARLTKPDRVVWCDGSEKEKKRLTEQCVKEQILLPLNQEKWPSCYLHRSKPNDVARVEHLTFICTRTKEEAGPFNNWMDPKEAYALLSKHFDGAMKGRTLYVVPYMMGPLGSPFSKVGIEITDSPYVVLNMGIMTRMGRPALDTLGDSNEFNRGLHSTGDLNPERRWICHFPEDNAIWSYGSGYGGNVLLGKKCLALRIGSYLGRQEGWLAEHMLILGVESPEGQSDYVAAAFPSACGKTNFAMMIPPRRFNGWRITTVGDDIAWMRVGPDGRLWATNPEAGYFGVVPGTNSKSNANAMRTIARDTIFTNVALDPSTNEPWWEDKDGPVPEKLLDWQGRPWTKDSGEKAAHPNSRFTSPAKNNPAQSPRMDDPMGVPISAIIFGGRRSTTVPLVIQSFNWTHGVYLGATMGSETTAAATGKVGVVRRDPMAMLPFHGYDLGTYLQHWLNMQHRIPFPPKIFQVNWFRKDREGKFIWPGFGENMRVLKWILDRVHGRLPAQETLLGWVPREHDIELRDLALTEERLAEATGIDLEDWHQELLSQGEFFEQMGKTAPEALLLQRKLLMSRLPSRPSKQ